MKYCLSRLVKNLFFLSIFIVCAFHTNAQQMNYTPYEELPSIDRILKPAYDNNMPDWAKMLYQYPVNFNEINRAFNAWQILNPDEKTPIRRYFKIWKMNIEPFAEADGIINVPNSPKMQQITANETKFKSLIRKESTVGAIPNWTLLGPKDIVWSAGAPSGSSTANVYSMDVVPNYPNVLYAGTETGFLNKSIDKGQTWTLSNINYNFGGGIQAVAVNPLNTDTVFVAAGNAIHRSLNGGVSWSKFSTGFQANRLKIDYSNIKKIVASTDKGVYITTDRGSNWSQKSLKTCWDIEFKPNSSDTIFAITQSATSFFEIIQSNDGGNTFTNISTFPTDIPQVSGGLLAVTPNNPNALYVIMLSKKADNSEVPFIYKGTLANNVWTWSLRYTGFSGLNNASGLTNGQGYFDLVLEVSPQNEDVLFAGTTTLFKSTNGGTTLSPIGGSAGSFSIHADIQDMKILPNGETWVATDGGMNYSSDYFESVANWKPLNKGLVGSDMWGFDQGWNEDLVVGGRYHNGNIAMLESWGDKTVKISGGETATGWVIKGKSRRAAFSDLGDGYIFPKTVTAAYEARFPFTKHPNMDEYGSFRTDVLTHPNYSGTMFVGNVNDMWKTTDFGVNFNLLYTFPDKIRFVGISTSNPNVMYADIYGNGFYKTADGGSTWTKPSSAGAPAWTGKMTFAISPYNSDVIYAAKQVGNWDTYANEVYVSKNAGASWTLWSSLGKSIKSIAIQPTSAGKDLVYAISTGVLGTAANVYYRKDGDAAWTSYSSNFPISSMPKASAIFFRDSKLRVAGNCGVWETPLAEPEFTPILVPWVEKRIQECNSDTIQLDDHSLLNHQGVSWNWQITPAPEFISNPNIRNPKIIVSQLGKYSATLTITKNGIVYTKVMPDFFEKADCPIISCNNKTELPKKYFRVVYADSYQAGNEPEKAFDGDISTIWHSSWTAPKPFPHEIQIDFGGSYDVSQFTYTGRQTGTNGMVKNYSLYISEDKNNWGSPVKTGVFMNTIEPQIVTFAEKKGRYARFVASSEVNNYNYTSAAEISFFGCNGSITGLASNNNSSNIRVFPIPSNSKITMTLPFNDGLKTYSYSVYSSEGKQIKVGKIEKNINELIVDVVDYKPGLYSIIIVDSNGTSFSAKFIKQ